MLVTSGIARSLLAAVAVLAARRVAGHEEVVVLVVAPTVHDRVVRQELNVPGLEVHLETNAGLVQDLVVEVEQGLLGRVDRRHLRQPRSDKTHFFTL